MSPITILVRVKVKAGKEGEFYKLAAGAVQSTHAKDKGCLTYIYHQHTEDARDFFLYEQWRDQEALQAHLDRLKQEYGPAREGEVVPAAIMDLWDTVQIDLYNVVEQKH
ncbi:MAG: putative quinol monooxygenase [Thermodesulfobacteriota bacterium]|jgi:quinol monooxygenase YgiN